MRKAITRLLILFNPIHPLKFSNETRRRVFLILKRSDLFKRYWRHYMKYFAGSQYQIWVKHKDGSRQKGNILYYPVMNDPAKAYVELWDENKLPKVRNIVELPVKYLSLTVV